MGFDPLTMAVVGLQAVGSIMQGQAAGEEARAGATIASRNAEAARRQAAIREQAIRRDRARQLGEQRAAAAQSGFDPNSGSFLELQGDSAAAAEYDALTARYEGALQALNFENEASGLRARGKAARRSGYLNAAGPLAYGFMRPYGTIRTQAPAPVETRTVP